MKHYQPISGNEGKVETKKF